MKFMQSNLHGLKQHHECDHKILLNHSYLINLPLGKLLESLYDDANAMDDDISDASTFEGEESTITDTDTECEEEAGRIVLAFDPSQLTSGGNNGLPQNGHDYIKLVQDERKKYPQVVSCAAPPPPPPPPPLEPPSSESLSSLEPKASSSSTAVASKRVGEIQDNTPYELKYHQEIIDNFRSLKEEIESIRQQNCDQVKRPNTSIEKSNNNKKSVIGERTKFSENSINRLLRRMELGYSPILSDIIDKDQYEIHQTLEKLADECEMMHSSYRVIHTDWIYSLMAALRDPIEADIYSTLRRLAKICIKNEKNYSEQRGKNEEESKIDRDTLNSCLLIICLVRHHFGQIDLK